MYVQVLRKSYVLVQIDGRYFHILLQTVTPPLTVCNFFVVVVVLSELDFCLYTSIMKQLSAPFFVGRTLGYLTNNNPETSSSNTEMQTDTITCTDALTQTDLQTYSCTDITRSRASRRDLVSPSRRRWAPLAPELLVVQAGGTSARRL